MGYLIAIEGIDGSGKTTISRYVKNILNDFGIKASILKEPSDSKYGKMLKNAKRRFPPEKELELFILDRIEDVEKNILPKLNSGISVIMDRYYYSNVAYQGALGIDPDEILRKNQEIAPKPDLTILLDLSPEKALERLRRRKGLTPYEDINYLERVRRIYLNIKSDEIRVVNAEEPLNVVKEECYNLILDLLASRGSLFESALRRY